MNFFKNLLLPLVLLCSSAVPMLAQDLYPVESGPFSTMSNSVDVATTQARLSIPVFSKNGRGIPFSFVLSVNNATYAIESGYVSGCNGGSHLLCWQEFIGGISTNPTRAIVPVGYSIGVITYNFGIVTLPCNGGNISGYSNVVYIDSRGSRHIFLSGSQAVFPPNTCGQPTTKNMVITDGSGLTWKADTSVPNFGGGQIIFPSGTVYNQDGVSGTSHRLTDSNGNYIQFIQDDSTHSHYIDTLGKTAISIDTSSAAQSKYTYTGSDGLPKEVDVNFTSRTRGASTFCGGYTQINSGTESVLSSIVYPDGSQYSFVFESNTDRLTSVTAPTGEVITYSYPNGGYVCNGVNNTSSPQITVAKTEGTWKYNTTYSGSLNTATVQDPAGNVTGYTFIGEQYAVGPYFEVQRTVNQGASTGIKTVDTCYNGSASPCTSTAIFFPINQVSSTTTVLPSGPVSKTVTFLNNYGLPIETDVYGFGPTLHHKNLIGYGSWNGTGCAALGNGINSRPCFKQETDASGSTQLRFTYSVYDEGTPTPTTGTPNHLSVTGARGNLTTSGVWTGGSSYLVSRNDFYDTGNIRDTTDPNNNPPVSYTYGACGNSFLTGVSLPLSLSVSATWDTSCDGGVVMSSIDVNGFGVSSTHNDPFWRTTSVTDELMNTINAYYTSPTEREAIFSFNSGHSILDSYSKIFPSSNASESQTLEAPGSSSWDTVVSDFLWDATGIKNESWMPCVSTTKGGGCVAAKSTMTHDALGRPLVATDGGGGTISHTYSNQDVLAVLGPAPAGEVVKQVRNEYNGLGQLVSSCQLSFAAGTTPCGQVGGGTGFLTTFTYNTDGTLASAVRGAQTHSATYDKVGRALTSTTPEGGLKQFFYDAAPSTPGVACSTLSLPTNYSPLGHLLKTYDANGTTACYSYDQLGRNTGIAYSGTNSDGLNKYFVYDSATVHSIAMVNVKGRVAEAYTAATVAGTKVTDEGFSYTARGEMSDVYQWSTHSGGWYHTTATYFENGALTTLAGISGGTWNFGLDGKGRPNTTLQGTTNEVTGVTFNAASQPLIITLGLGDKDTYTYDDNTGRMASYDFAIKATPVHFTGMPTWNPNGTLRGLTVVDGINAGADSEVCDYGDATHAGYDEIGRLIRVNCWNGATAVWGQNFAYDAYDNLSKTVPTGQTGTTWAPNYNSDNNRYSTATYDSNGNVLTDTFHTYTWNQDNHPKTITDAGLTMTYDAFGRMVEKYNGTTYQQELISPIGPVALMTGQTVTQFRIPLPGGATALNGINFEHKDWLGSASFVSNRNRTSTAARLFSPYGEIYNNVGITGDVDFTGDRQDLVAGLYDTPNRELNPSGRWISPDPAGASWNAYQYSTNPMRETDPSGLGNAADDFGTRAGSGNFNAFDSEWKHLWVNADYRNQRNWDNHEASINPDHAPLPGGRDANGNFVGTFTVVDYGTVNEMGFGAPAQNNGEGSQANQSRREGIADAAVETKQRADLGQTQYGPNQCSALVAGCISKAGAKAEFDNSGRPPVAGEWANKKANIPGWRPLGPGEKPAPGDVAAVHIRNPHPGATGDSAIVVRRGSGLSAIEAGSHGVEYNSLFIHGYRDVAYWRYTGD